ELYDLFATVGPIVHLATAIAAGGKQMVAVVMYSTSTAAGQALQYLQSYSLQPPFRLHLQAATPMAVNFVGMSQQLLSGELSPLDSHNSNGSILDYSDHAGLEAGLAALQLGQRLGAADLASSAQALDGGPAMFHHPGHHHPADAWPMGMVGPLGHQDMGPALMQAALAQQQRGLNWMAARQRGLMARPLGKEGASKEPTVKLWLGGVDGSATLEIIDDIFGKFGPLADKELQQARHERGRTDQWGFVVFKQVSDSQAAYDNLCGKVIPELTGTRRLKLQYRTPDPRRNRAILVTTA
ncbi:hypothetical protein APUTEX25_001998, partial [Auxenochlorella protothecoides]